jgi:hypothetical protein
MTPTVLQLRQLLILAAGIATVVLTLVVLTGHPHNEFDLLAWAGFSAGIGLMAVPIKPG